MIPEITKILEMFKAGECTMTQALGWIEQHMANADLRDHFAAKALPFSLSQTLGGTAHKTFNEVAADDAYRIADAMLKARSA